MAIGLTIIVCSLFYIILLTVVYLSKQRMKNVENAIYDKLIILDLLGLVLEFFCCMTVSNIIEGEFLKYLVCKAFLVSILTWIYFFSKYMVTVSFNNDNRITLKIKNKYSFLAHIFNSVYYLFLIAVLTLPIKYFYDGTYTYSYGLSVNILFFAIGFFIFISLISTLMNLKKIPRKKTIPMFVFLLFVVFAMIVRLINPGILLINATTTFVTVLMYFTIENPDIKMVQQLEIAKETADKANNSKTEFLSSMSHEIRTPLNAICGFSDCIVDAHSLEEAKENAKDIVNASQTLLEIVNGILDISKIEAGKMEIVNTKYNARETFLELAKLITPRMHDKGLDFTYFIDPNLPATLFGDKANIKKIVTNFLSNACKYTDKGFVRYEVHSVKLGDYCRLVISVEDSGRGIKKASVDKLFTRFQRLDEDRNTTIEGTGLGLAITKQLTELMGGKVIFHTVYGEGSKFTVVINQKIESMDVVEDFTPHTTLDLSGVRILIVDDAPLNLKVASKLFEKFKADHIETCSSGFECLDRIQSGKEYDLIFLDDMMPKMSGIETFGKLKEIEGFHTPTIALTANAITGMREKYLSVGFNDYLAKPMEQSEIIRVCNTLLGRSKSTDESSDEEEDEVSELEKTSIIPVEENIEEIIGDAANLKGNYKSEISNYDDIEVLDDLESVSAAVTSLIPVADIEYPTEPTIVSTEPVEEETSSTYDRKFLEDHGVDVNKALEMLGDMDMYNSTVHDFVSEVDAKWQRLNDYLAAGNMDDYAIDVHSLKSDCKYLGFMSLADIAYEHELKSKEKDLDFVKNHFSELEEEYKKTLEIAKEYAEHNPVSE